MLERTRDIDNQNSNQRVLEQRVQLSSRTKGLVDKSALAGDTNRVKDVESVVPAGISNETP